MIKTVQEALAKYKDVVRSRIKSLNDLKRRYGEEDAELCKSFDYVHRIVNIDTELAIIANLLDLIREERETIQREVESEENTPQEPINSQEIVWAMLELEWQRSGREACIKLSQKIKRDVEASKNPEWAGWERIVLPFFYKRGEIVGDIRMYFLEMADALANPDEATDKSELIGFCQNLANAYIAYDCAMSGKR